MEQSVLRMKHKMDDLENSVMYLTDQNISLRKVIEKNNIELKAKMKKLEGIFIALLLFILTFDSL